MRSIKFPKMFNTNNTNVWKDSEYNACTMQNTLLLLHTEKGELFGDPYFGLMFKHYLFDQNNYVLRDALIDMIYTQLALFIPQVRVNRNDIKLVSGPEKGKLYCTFHGINQIDFTVNTYNLLVFDNQEIA